MSYQFRMSRCFIGAGLLLCGLLAAPGFAHQATYFMPEVPNPDAMIIDGRDDDWGWFDPAFAITPEQLFDVVNWSPWPIPRDDWDCTLYVAWSALPDNALYYFARVSDDSLSVVRENTQEYWIDDSLEVVIDADHSGEDYKLTEHVSGQQYGMRILPAAGLPAVTLYYDLNNPTPNTNLQWSAAEPHFTFGWTLDPPDAKSLEQPLGSTVTYTYEVRQKIWTLHDQNGVDGSVEHIFAPDQIIGLNFAFDESDDGIWRQHHIGTTPKAGAHETISLGSDFIAVPTPGASGGVAQTAVEVQSWGRIKAFMGR